MFIKTLEKYIGNTLLIFLIYLSLCCSVGHARTIIVDHNAVEQFDQIPDYWINEVKKMLLGYPGESHSHGMLSGLRLLEQMDSRFAVSIRISGEPESQTDQYLRVYHWTAGEEDTWTNQTAIDALNIYLQGNSFDAFAFGWCWDMTWHNAPGGGVDPVYGVRWAGSSEGGPDGDLRWGLDDEDTVLTENSVNMQDYLDAWDYYEQNNPGTTIIYSTGPVDSTGESGYQRYLKHERIREWVSNGTDRVLFDYGDILTYNNAGEQNTATWDGHSYPQEHPENNGEDDPFGYGSGHLGNEGYLKIAKAMWWLLARIAGWNDCEAVYGDITGNYCVNMADYNVISLNWMRSDCQEPFGCDGADLSGDGSVNIDDLVFLADNWLNGYRFVAQLNADKTWLYQNVSGLTNSQLTMTISITDDSECQNNSYAYEWEMVLPCDVDTAPVTIDGGGVGDAHWTIATGGCDQPGCLSDSGQPYKVKVTITGNEVGNKAVAEVEFGMALLGDVNNDTLVDVADTTIINAFWRTGSAGDFTLQDCDINSDNIVDVADITIANAVWKGTLCQNCVSNPCPLR